MGKSTFRINFKFHSNLGFDGSKILLFPSFYEQLFRNWRKYLSSSVTIHLPFCHNQFGMTNDKNIKINKPIYVAEFTKQNMLQLMQKSQIKSKTVMSWSSRKNNEPIVTDYFIRFFTCF